MHLHDLCGMRFFLSRISRRVAKCQSMRFSFSCGFKHSPEVDKDTPFCRGVFKQIGKSLW